MIWLKLRGRRRQTRMRLRYAGMFRRAWAPTFDDWTGRATWICTSNKGARCLPADPGGADLAGLWEIVEGVSIMTASFGDRSAGQAR